MTIFLNYRREDSRDVTGRIDDHLRRAFVGEGDVYRDIDSIPLGVDFVDHLQNALAKCDLCVVIIGPNWVSDRLMRPDDFVRLELEAVLARKIPVIPVLVGKAQLPTPDQLPTTLHPLLRWQATVVDSGVDFKTHVDRLVEAIRKIRREGAREQATGQVPLGTEANRAATAASPTGRPQVRNRRYIGPYAIGAIGGFIGLFAVILYGVYLRTEGYPTEGYPGVPPTPSSPVKPPSTPVLLTTYAPVNTGPPVPSSAQPPPAVSESRPEAGAGPRIVSPPPAGGCDGKCAPASSEQQAALQLRAQQARRCYTQALASDSSLRGHVTVLVRIGPNGNLCLATVVLNDTGSPGVANCVANTFRNMGSYPASHAGCVEAPVPMTFVPGSLTQ